MTVIATAGIETTGTAGVMIDETTDAHLRPHLQLRTSASTKVFPQDLELTAMAPLMAGRLTHLALRPPRTHQALAGHLATMTTRPL
jgi:hypothetical protein